jgi:hypothetical protein
MLMLIENASSRLDAIRESERINAVRGAILPEAIGRTDFSVFSLSSSLSKYWLRINIPAVANEKARKSNVMIFGEGKDRKTLPISKEKIHPSQLSILTIARYSLRGVINWLPFSIENRKSLNGLMQCNRPKHQREPTARIDCA